MKPLCLIDMDGTLVDFFGQMLSDLTKLRSPQEAEYLEVSEWDDDPPHIKGRKRMIKDQPNWWVDLPKYQPGWDIYALAQELGFRFHVLTKGPHYSGDVWRQKFEWCRKHLGDSVPVSITEDKSISLGDVLVDDWVPYVEPWLANNPNGLVIMPAHAWNNGFTHPRVTRYDGTNIEEVRRVLASKNKE